MPVDAKVERGEFEKKINELQGLAEKETVKINVRFGIETLGKQLAEVQKKKAELESKPVSKGAFESEDNFKRRQVEQAKELEGLSLKKFQLESRVVEAYDKQVDASEKQAQAAASNVANQEAAIKKQIDLLNTQKAERESGLSKQLAAGQITQQQYEDELRAVQRVNLEKEKGLKTKQLGTFQDQNSEGALTLRREIAALDKGIADNQIETANAAFKKEKDRVDIAKDRIGIEQEVLEVADKVSSIDKKRLQTVEQIVDAFSNLADAQNNLVKSEFDVKSARNSRDIFNAEKEKEAIQKDAEKRGVDPKRAVEEKEKEINALKEQGKEIERQALEAAIEGAARRFEIERKALQLKQAQRLLDAQDAVRSSERNLLNDRKEILELRGKLKDPNLTADARANIQEQLALKEQIMQLNSVQAGSDKDRLNSLQAINSLELQTLEAKQQAETNSFRASAASEGWEESLQMGLDKLDQQAGKIAGVEGATRKGAIAWEEVSSAANGVLDVIDDHTEAVDMEKAKIGELAQAYKGLNQGASFDGAERIFNDGAPTGGGFAEDDARQSADRIIGIYASAEDQMNANRRAHFEEMIALEQQYQRETDQLAESIGGAMDSLSKPMDDDPFANYDRFLENAKRQFSPEAIREAIEGSSFSLSDLIQPAEPIDLQVTADTSEAEQALSDLSVTEENFNLQGLDDSFGQIGQSAGQQFSSAFDSSVQFDATGQQFDDAFNVDGTLNSLNAVSSAITGLKGEYQTIEPNVNDAELAQDAFGNGIGDSISAANNLASSWVEVAMQIRNAASELDALRSAPATPAYWAGGYATAGRTIQVNEIGAESFLDRSGALRMINAPQYGHWNPPSDGVVIPADVTARLKAVGAFGGHQQGIYEQRARAASMPQNARQLQAGTGNRASAESSMQRNHMSRAMAQQINAMNMLNKNIDALTRKDWNVSIRMPSNAGLLRTVQGL